MLPSGQIRATACCDASTGSNISGERVRLRPRVHSNAIPYDVDSNSKI